MASLPFRLVVTNSIRLAICPQAGWHTPHDAEVAPALRFLQHDFVLVAYPRY